MKHHSATHGMSSTLTYRVWDNMKGRCQNTGHKYYKDYGGRGITVCERWQDFANFYEDMGEKPKGMTLDRIDNEKGYFPGNCRWASRRQQSNNRRVNRKLTLGGKTQTAKQWAREVDMHYTTLLTRLNLGWTTEDALTRPVKKYRHHN